MQLAGDVGMRVVRLSVVLPSNRTDITGVGEKRYRVCGESLSKMFLRTSCTVMHMPLRFMSVSSFSFAAAFRATRDRGKNGAERLDHWWQVVEE